MKCPFCYSEDVDEICPDFVAGDLNNLIWDGNDSFAIFDYLEVGYHVAQRAITGKTPYHCNNCKRDFKK